MLTCRQLGTSLTRSVVEVVDPLGTVCGYQVLVGGPAGGQRVPPPALARECAKGSPTTGDPQFIITITASNGKRYVAYPSSSVPWGFWSARLPAGTYHAVGWACFAPGNTFVVKAGETLRSVRVDRGCTVP